VREKRNEPREEEHEKRGRRMTSWKSVRLKNGKTCKCEGCVEHFENARPSLHGCANRLHTRKGSKKVSSASEWQH